MGCRGLLVSMQGNDNIHAPVAQCNTVTQLSLCVSCGYDCTTIHNAKKIEESALYKSCPECGGTDFATTFVVLTKYVARYWTSTVVACIWSLITQLVFIYYSPNNSNYSKDLLALALIFISFCNFVYQILSAIERRITFNRQDIDPRGPKITGTVFVGALSLSSAIIGLLVTMLNP